MGFIKQLGALIEDEADIRRWITILEADPTLEEPAFELEVAYVKDDVFAKLIRPIRKKTGEISTSPHDQERFRKGFFNLAVKDWKGATRGNFMRASEHFMMHPEVLPEDTVEIPFSKEDLEELAKHVSLSIWNEVVEASCSMEEFARNRVEQEKKLSTSS